VITLAALTTAGMATSSVSAKVAPGYYIGKTKQDSSALLLVAKDQTWRFKSSVNCARSDTSESFDAQVEVLDEVFRRGGRFDTGALFGQNDLRVRGTAADGRVTGKVDYVARHDEARWPGGDWSCAARGVGFKAKRMSGGLIARGHYKGLTFCEAPPGPACATYEMHPASLDVRRRTLRNVKVPLRCADDSSGEAETVTRSATATRIRLRWDGSFAAEVEAGRDTFYFRGRARGKTVDGHAELTHTEDTGDGGYTACLGKVAFTVTRRSA
jgi:hypothetical protein